MLKGSEKPRYLPSVSWRTGKSGGIVQSEDKGLRTRERLVEVPASEGPRIRNSDV